MVEEVKNDVVKVIKDLKGQIGSLREDHSELGNHKLALVRKNIESSLSELREKQILLEKHEKKYNVLIYGIDKKNLSSSFLLYLISYQNLLPFG
jgi:uncharacterized protein with gpF-like domain